MHSDTLSMDYAEKVQISAKNLTWAEQVNNKTIQTLYLFYATVKEVKHSSSNKMLSVENTHIPYVEDTTNTYTPQSVELLAIPYSAN